MNASERVARGAALQCAILSPTFKAREFEVNEWFPASIALSLKVASAESQAAENQQSTIVFRKGNPIPSVSAIKFEGSGGSYSLNLLYANASELQAPANISTCTIGLRSTRRVRIKVTAQLNLHGIVSIESAILKVDAPVAALVYGGVTPLDLEKAVEKEFEMALQDRVMEETKDKKNAIESYVYDMRNQLNDNYHDFIIESEKEQLMATLQEAETWLYRDGVDKTKDVYLAKLEELKKQGDPIEERYEKFTERGTQIDQLIYCINSYRDAALSNDTKFDHIHLSEKLKVLNECAAAEAWLREKKQQQDALPKYDNHPVLLSADIKKKAEVVDMVCRPIMAKPKPANPAASDVRSVVPSRFAKKWLIPFSYEELRDSTNDFSRTNFLGEGGFAKVYKGSLSNGEKVVVKVLKNENSKADEEFWNEVDIISRARHRNIVSLLGYCITQTKRLIVCEFVENRSLQDHLRGGKDEQVMDWAVRIKIARGSAKGFAYLHEECPQKIIHGDVKPANILLDFSFVPKVADFGISKLYPDHFDSLIATYAGSEGLIDPVYRKTKELSAKSDVYAFGVVLLMLISGQINLVAVQELKNALPGALRSGKFHEIADIRLKKRYNEDEMTRMVICADACLRRDPEDRPDMSQVSRVLENIVSANDLRIKTRPKQSVLMVLRAMRAGAEG